MSDIINVSDVMINNLSFDGMGANTIQLTDVLRDLTTQLDNRIGIGLMFILSIYVLQTFIIKHYKKWLIQLVPYMEDTINKSIDVFYNVIEFFGLGASLFILYVWYLQNGFNIIMKIWIVLLLMSIALSIYLQFKEKQTNGNIFN